MISFFRKIRKGLLNDNKISKYLKYSIGEIVLVMIGILLALQVNNWNNERIEAKQEVLMLVQLQTEYEENIEEINEKIFMRDEMRTSIQKLFYYMDNGIEGVSFDSLSAHIGRSGMLPTFGGANGVTNEILSSGKLYLIQNAELKNHLTNWYGVTQEVIEEEQLLVQDFSPRYYDYMTHNYNRRKMIGNNKADSFKDVFRLSKNVQVDYRIQGEHDESEYLRYLSDVTISNYLLVIHGGCKGANDQAYGLKEKAERILAIISEELEQNQ